MRCCCGPTCAKWTTFSISVVVLVLGILLAVLWEKLFHNVVNNQLSIANKNSQGFKNWQETPIPMYLEFHLFNWTNADRVQKNSGVKPQFEEVGPYIFYEHHIRENITFNNNDTVTFLNKRTWKFEPEMSNGSLNDSIIALNPIVVVVTNQIKDEHYLVKRAVNFFLEEKNEGLSVTKPVHELLFDGYDDPLLDISIKLNISGIKLPFTKFGWFVDRNNSAEYDGVFNMYSGGNDISKLGVVAKWNYENKTKYYPGDCGVVGGTTGELWYPPHDDESVSIFSPDLCSSITLHRNGGDSLYGIKGHQYEGQADVFDNGTNYENGKCFASGVRTGVRDVSSCKFGAPAYMSFPHFYLADPAYIEAVDGMKPDREKHSTKISLEPDTGLPLRVHASFQLNLLMRNVEGIDVLSNVKDTMMPCFWFVQRAELSEDLAKLAKTILIASKAGTYTGYGLIGLGVILFSAFAFVTYRKGWKSNEEAQYLISETN